MCPSSALARRSSYACAGSSTGPPQKKQKAAKLTFQQADKNRTVQDSWLLHFIWLRCDKLANTAWCAYCGKDNSNFKTLKKMQSQNMGSLRLMLKRRRAIQRVSMQRLSRCVTVVVLGQPTMVFACVRCLMNLRALLQASQENIQSALQRQTVESAKGQLQQLYLVYFLGQQGHAMST